MKWFRRKPEPVPYGDWPLIQDWEIETAIGDGTVFTMRGHVFGYAGADEAQAWVRYVRGVTKGLRAEGFDPKVTVTRSESVDWNA